MLVPKTPNSLSATEHIEELIAQGRYLEARFLSEKVKIDSDLKAQQLYGLALSKSGMPEDALQLLEPLYRSNGEDPETAGILGSIYKELFKKNQKTTFAQLSRDTYLNNFSTTKSYYTGINAASMSAMLMQGSRSRDIAREVITLIDAATTNFWELATLGEANLILKNINASIEFYVKARKIAGNDWGKIGSVFNQLWLLNHFIPVSREVMKIFNPPGIIAFVGHMVDQPSRNEPRFPPSLESQIKSSISNNIKTINAHIGFCSLACGGDILFAEAMAELGREVNIFLPFDVKDFLDVSVRYAGENWVERFQMLYDKFPVNMITHENYGGMDQLFDFQCKVIFGSAMLRSSLQQNKTSLLTVLSETDLKKKIGGTNHSLNIWPLPDNHININPDIFSSVDTVSLNTNFTVPEKIYPIPFRKILNLVMINVSRLIPLNKEKILKELAMIEINSSIIRWDVNVNEILFGFEVEFSAFDLMKKMQELMTALPKDQHFSVALHSGVVNEIPSFRGDTVDVIFELNKLNAKGICVSGNVAAMLALQIKKYTLDFSGSVNINNTKHLIYRVS
jgi:hypothetical protein